MQRYADSAHRRAVSTRRAAVAAAVFAVTGMNLLPATSAENAPSGWDFGSRGWEWSNHDSGSYLWTGLRFQPRYSSHIENIHELEDFDKPQESGVRMNRARFKIGTHDHGLTPANAVHCETIAASHRPRPTPVAPRSAEPYDTPVQGAAS